MVYSGLAFFAIAMVALALDFVGLAPGAAGVVNVALLVSMASFLAAGGAHLGNRHLPFVHRRQTRHQ